MSQIDPEFDHAARLAGLVGQIGCLTGFSSIIIVAIAFAVGRFLDSRLGTDGIFTVLFMVGSFPITLYVIVRISLAIVKRVQPPETESKDKGNDSNSEEEAGI